MPQDPSRKTQDLIERLHKRGHVAAARSLTRALESGVLLTLRETLETLLTAVEAIDPVTETMIEELRLQVEKLVRPPKDDEDDS